MYPIALVYYINMKIQTSSSTIAPHEVLALCIEDLSAETDHLITQFSEAVEDFKRKNSTEMGGTY